MYMDDSRNEENEPNEELVNTASFIDRPEVGEESQYGFSTRRRGSMESSRREV